MRLHGASDVWRAHNGCTTRSTGCAPRSGASPSRTTVTSRLVSAMRRRRLMVTAGRAAAPGDLPSRRPSAEHLARPLRTVRRWTRTAGSRPRAATASVRRLRGRLHSAGGYGGGGCLSAVPARDEIRRHPSGALRDSLGGNSTMRLEFTLAGISPIVMHNGAAGLDARSPLSREIAAIAAKKGGNRTDVDDKRLREIECQRSLYLDADGRAGARPRPRHRGNISVTVGRCSRSASTSTRGAAGRSRGGSIAWTGGLPRRSRPRWPAWSWATCPTPEASGQASWSTGSTPGRATGRDGDALIVLLGGGTKARQQRDIETARKLWCEYRRRKRPEE